MNGFRRKLHAMKRKFFVTAFTLAPLLLPSGVFASDVFAGKIVYEKHCVRCHGSEGTPIIPGTPNFSTGERLQNSERTLITGIRTGKNLMPGYDRIISEPDILNVLSYIRTLWR